MLYYKVKREYDNCNMYKGNKCIGFLVGNELYTKKERERLPVPDKCFEIVEINKNHTYWFFGARFNDNGKGLQNEN